MKICKHDASCLSSAVRGARNGIYYGAKIRFMHALVMTFLFKKGTLKEKIAHIIKLTYEHAKNLGIFVFFYKYIVCILTRLMGNYNKIFSMISGSLVGYIIFRKKTAVNQQIIFYLLSRVIIGGVQNLQKKNVVAQFNIHPMLAAICWGVVMYLFEDDPNCLQSSLNDSMQFLYKESNQPITSWLQLLPVDIPYFISFFKKI